MNINSGNSNSNSNSIAWYGIVYSIVSWQVLALVGARPVPDSLGRVNKVELMSLEEHYTNTTLYYTNTNTNTNTNTKTNANANANANTNTNTVLYYTNIIL